MTQQEIRDLNIEEENFKQIKELTQRKGSNFKRYI